MTYDICIIGAGVIGCALARELSRYNINILLLEKGNDVALGCTKANSGILHGGYDAIHGTKKSQFVYEGNQLYDTWNEELNFGIHRCGSFVVAFDNEQVQTLQKLKHNGTLNGITNLHIISKEELLEKEQNLNSSIIAALYCKHSGIISPYEVALALAENAIANGTNCVFHAQVQSLAQDRNAKKWIIGTSHKEYYAKIIINAAGIYSDTIAKLTGINSYTITPRKGNYYVFKRDYSPVSHVIFQTPTNQGKGVLISPTYHGNIIIGPDSQEVNSKDDTDPDPYGLEYIVNTAKLTLPSLNMKMALRTYAGIRPSLKEIKDFKIDCSVPNCIHLLGIDSPGLTSAPSIAQHVIQQIDRLFLPLTKRSNFIATRTAYISRQKEKVFLPMKDIVQLSKLEDGNPKRIICQCEQVQEKIIQTALKRAPYPLSIDAIKRRTRASMGYCQGNICRPRLRSILAKQLNIDEQDVSDT